MENLPESLKKDIWDHAKSLAAMLPDSFTEAEQFRGFIQARVSNAIGLEQMLVKALSLCADFPIIQEEIQHNLDDERGVINGKKYPEKAHGHARKLFCKG